LYISLHLREEGLEHLSGGCLEQLLGLIVVLLANSIASEELRSLVGEHVAVVVDDIVFLRSVLVRNVLQELLKHLLGDLSLAKRDFLDGLAVWSGLGSVMADASTEVVLPAEYDEGSVVDGVNLLADHHHTHGAGHAHGDVVDEKGDFLCHLNYMMGRLH
jgi:hypothetical protein